MNARIRRASTVKVGSQARIAIRASHLSEAGVMSWAQIAEQIGYPYPEKLSALIEEYAATIQTEYRRRHPRYSNL